MEPEARGAIWSGLLARGRGFLRPICMRWTPTVLLTCRRGWQTRDRRNGEVEPIYGSGSRVCHQGRGNSLYVPADGATNGSGLLAFRSSSCAISSSSLWSRPARIDLVSGYRSAGTNAWLSCAPPPRAKSPATRCTSSAPSANIPGRCGWEISSTRRRHGGGSDVRVPGLATEAVWRLKHLRCGGAASASTGAPTSSTSTWARSLRPTKIVIVGLGIDVVARSWVEISANECDGTAARSMASRRTSEKMGIYARGGQWWSPEGSAKQSRASLFTGIRLDNLMHSGLIPL